MSFYIYIYIYRRNSIYCTLRKQQVRKSLIYIGFYLYTCESVCNCHNCLRKSVCQDFQKTIEVIEIETMGIEVRYFCELSRASLQRTYRPEFRVSYCLFAYNRARHSIRLRRIVASHLYKHARKRTCRYIIAGTNYTYAFTYLRSEITSSG